jgi:hypothetical protein
MANTVDTEAVRVGVGEEFGVELRNNITDTRGRPCHQRTGDGVVRSQSRQRHRRAERHKVENVPHNNVPVKELSTFDADLVRTDPCMRAAGSRTTAVVQADVCSTGSLV